MEEAMKDLLQRMSTTCVPPADVHFALVGIIDLAAQKQKEREEQLNRIEKKLDDVLNSF